MSLPHAILTALLEKPSSGLELTRRFDKSIGYFWSATHQQIYRELAGLEQSGFIRALPSAAPARGQKKEYEVLPAGRAELTEWAAAGQDPKPMRDPLLLRMRAAAVIGTDGLRDELERHLALHLAQLTTYHGIETKDFPPGRGSEQDRLRHLVLRGGIELETFWIGWLTEALGALAAEPEKAPDAPAVEPGKTPGTLGSEQGRDQAAPGQT
ncbi:PadR family transcriptional regulator [Streptomyces sp. MBT27]|uniref:PadR family transcriptional regulator n=1 Tax=Streptomyces sp. MBT27 TaxID=1488356 RepID=UPI00141DB1F5|nr:PadR family transcriptional regulator [Streptomyces sp. MBT27]